MNGDFKGDFTRDTFDKINHFSRVLMQQGRVSLDADWNEQIDILQYYLRTLTMDLIGSRAARDTGKVKGFFVSPAPQPTKTRGTRSKATTSPPPDIIIGEGHYYVDGILCESDGTYTFTFSGQRNNNPIYVVYLDVWERQVTFIENKSIREVALGLLGPDTATRAKIEWRVRATNSMPKSGGTYDTIPITNQLPSDANKQQLTTFIDGLDANWVEQWIPTLQYPYRGLLKAKIGGPSQQDTTPCIIAPTAGFRGTENQLYRVEIHDSSDHTATFKWSRENGSVVFPISSLSGKVITLDTPGRDKRFGLKQDDWVEIVDDDYYGQDEPISLVQIESVDAGHGQVILKEAPTTSVGQNIDKHPFLRRWDQNGGELMNGDSVTVINGAIQIVEGDGDTNWITLENNIQIQFQAADPKTPNRYRSGDYWLIPARTATGNIEWPPDEKDATLPKAVEPHGVEHHFAPLALVFFNNEKIADDGIHDLRRTLKQLWDSPTG